MFDTGSTGFMLVCTMLVLLMTPGLAFITTAITPAAGFVEPWAAAVMGFAGSPCCYFAISVCKKSFGYDDALDVLELARLVICRPKLRAS